MSTPRRARIYLLTFNALGGCENDVSTSRNVRAFRKQEQAEALAKELTTLIQEYLEARTAHGRAVHQRLPWSEIDILEEGKKALFAQIRAKDEGLDKYHEFGFEDYYSVEALYLEA